MAESPVPIEHFPKAQSTFEIPHIANGNAFLGDVLGSPSSTDGAATPIAGGLFRMTKGDALTCLYAYHETLIVLDGGFDISDDAGNKSVAGPGDIYYLPKGSKVTFSTRDFGLAFYTAQRAKKVT